MRTPFAHAPFQQNTKFEQFSVWCFCCCGDFVHMRCSFLWGAPGAFGFCMGMSKLMGREFGWPSLQIQRFCMFKLSILIRRPCRWRFDLLVSTSYDSRCPFPYDFFCESTFLRTIHHIHWAMVTAYYFIIHCEYSTRSKIKCWRLTIAICCLLLPSY